MQTETAKVQYAKVLTLVWLVALVNGVVTEKDEWVWQRRDENDRSFRPQDDDIETDIDHVAAEFAQRGSYRNGRDREPTTRTPEHGRPANEEIDDYPDHPSTVAANVATRNHQYLGAQGYLGYANGGGGGIGGSSQTNGILVGPGGPTGMIGRPQQYYPGGGIGGGGLGGVGQGGFPQSGLGGYGPTGQGAYSGGLPGQGGFPGGVGGYPGGYGTDPTGQLFPGGQQYPGAQFSGGQFPGGSRGQYPLGGQFPTGLGGQQYPGGYAGGAGQFGGAQFPGANGPGGFIGGAQFPGIGGGQFPGSGGNQFPGVGGGGGQQYGGAAGAQFTEGYGLAYLNSIGQFAGYQGFPGYSGYDEYKDPKRKLKVEGKNANISELRRVQSPSTQTATKVDDKLNNNFKKT